MNKFCPAIVGLGQNSYYWTFLFYPQTYKVFVNLIGLDFRKCPVVWSKLLSKSFIPDHPHTTGNFALPEIKLARSRLKTNSRTSAKTYPSVLAIFPPLQQAQSLLSHSQIATTHSRPRDSI